LQLSQIHRSGSPAISFELYPPKTDEAEARLFAEDLPELVRLRPAFITCTYGAGGSTRDRTLRIVSRIRHEYDMDVASHLTCVGASRQEIGAYLDQTAAEGITNIVALRGDPPRGDSTFRPHPEGFQYAGELIAFIREREGFDIAVAGYPEGHPECEDKHLDWRRCADKVSAGADVVITQLFYDNARFFEFEDYLKNNLNVRVPIVPGVLPILGAAQIRRFCSMCKSSLPASVLARLDQYADDDIACGEYGIELATRMCEELLRRGAPGIHFYVLNRAHAVGRILQNLGLRSQ
jgi:methylenetetrahydrofolate reductase (NADPH)